MVGTSKIIFFAFSPLRGVLKRVAENYFVKALIPFVGVEFVRNTTSCNVTGYRQSKPTRETANGSRPDKVRYAEIEKLNQCT
jgi:hypothetical protein